MADIVEFVVEETDEVAARCDCRSEDLACTRTRFVAVG